MLTYLKLSYAIVLIIVLLDSKSISNRWSIYFVGLTCFACLMRPLVIGLIVLIMFGARRTLTLSVMNNFLLLLLCEFFLSHLLTNQLQSANNDQVLLFMIFRRQYY